MASELKMVPTKLPMPPEETGTQSPLATLVLIRIELIGAGHGHANGSQRVQDADGFSSDL